MHSEGRIENQAAVEATTQAIDGLNGGVVNFRQAPASPDRRAHPQAARAWASRCRPTPVAAAVVRLEGRDESRGPDGLGLRSRAGLWDGRVKGRVYERHLAEVVQHLSEGAMRQE